jgi:hypothetical protein
LSGTLFRFAGAIACHEAGQPQGAVLPVEFEYVVTAEQPVDANIDNGCFIVGFLFLACWSGFESLRHSDHL